MMCLQVFFYWLFAKTINYYSSLNVLGITGGNIFFDKDGTFQWSSIAALVSFVAACLTLIGVFINVSTQKKIAKQQIDANLKAKARIKWIQEVRQLVSEYLVIIHKVGELLFLLNGNNIKNKQAIQRNRSTTRKDVNESNKQYDMEKSIIEKEQKELLSELEGQKYQALAVSEKLVLYFSIQNEHKIIIGKLNSIRELIIDIYNKAYGPGINENYYNDKSPILNTNSKELSKEISQYLKKEWDKAKEGK
ncbi:hypothetical protein [Enterococcus faecalis]|uniref:hypothetical protein n=1 Tax=Enterococcus faecalis TaxID=1351 RepID=UPI0022E5AC91|nr:hypothetical protein [Enterococcus faecalis]MDN3149030.1 hypothetical protein [Enterococcus faecalis]